jgi:glutathione S-transferase
MADGQVIADSTEILSWVDRRTPAERRLFPDEDAVREQVVAWESRFDDELGPEVRRLAHFHLLPAKETALSVLTQGNPRAEAAGFRAGFPLVRRWMMRSLKVTTAGAERAATKVRAVFDAVTAGLDDGRRYLVGERFSAADLAFGALSAPVLQPKNPDLVGLPAAFTTYVRELRALPAGRYGLRLLRDERG